MRHYYIYISHKVQLISKADPLKLIMSRPLLSGRLAKWSLMLMEFDITYVSKNAIKGQALADFLAAHPVPDDSPLSTDLPDEEALSIEAPGPIGRCTFMELLRESPGQVAMLQRRARELEWSFSLRRKASCIIPSPY